MVQYELYFKNQQRNPKGIYNVEKETKNFLWLNNGYDHPIKVDKIYNYQM